MQPQDSAPTPFDDLTLLEPRFGEVARLLKDLRDRKSINFTADGDRTIFEHLSELLRQATL
jgi:hypothetical protein